MKKALTAASAQDRIVAPRLGTLTGAKGAEVPIDFSFLTAGSVFFDAVCLPGGPTNIETLKIHDKALPFVKGASLPCKAMAAPDGGIDLIFS